MPWPACDVRSWRRHGHSQADRDATRRRATSTRSSVLQRRAFADAAPILEAAGVAKVVLAPHFRRGEREDVATLAGA
jgi:hypothetical protein